MIEEYQLPLAEPAPDWIERILADQEATTPAPTFPDPPDRPLPIWVQRALDHRLPPKLYSTRHQA